jgi:putative heme iron utilization protein
VRLFFPEPLGSASDMRARLVEMARQARAASAI